MKPPAPRAAALLLLAASLATGCGRGGGSPAGAEDPAFQEHRRRALARFRSGDFDGAVAEAEKAVAIAPKEKEACAFLSRLHIDLGRDGKAVELFARIAKRHPDSAPAWFYKGFHEFRLSRWDDALASFTRAAEADPAGAEAHFRRGLVLQAKGDFAGAAAALARARQLDPAAPLPAVRLARVLRILGRYDEADRLVADALGRAPGSAELWHARAQLRERDGRTAEAEEALRRALSLDPSLREAHHDLARLLLRSGRREEGLREKAIARRLADYMLSKEALLGRAGLDPRNPEFALAVAELELTERNYDEAWRWLGRARSLGAPTERAVPLAVEICAGRGALDRCRDETAALEGLEGPRALLARAALAAAEGRSAELTSLLDRVASEASLGREMLRRIADLETWAGRSRRAADLLLRAETATAVSRAVGGPDTMAGTGDAE